MRIYSSWIQPNSIECHVGTTRCGKWWEYNNDQDRHGPSPHGAESSEWEIVLAMDCDWSVYALAEPAGTKHE